MEISIFNNYLLLALMKITFPFNRMKSLQRKRWMINWMALEASTLMRIWQKLGQAYTNRQFINYNLGNIRSHTGSCCGLQPRPFRIYWSGKGYGDTESPWIPIKWLEKAIHDTIPGDFIKRFCNWGSGWILCSGVDQKQYRQAVLSDKLFTDYNCYKLFNNYCSIWNCQLASCKQT